MLIPAENKYIECYTVSVNHDGTKLASGGLDGKVKIWDIQSILRFQEPGGTLLLRMESEPGIHRALASMSRHNGVVTCVKFSPDGRFLASGSDDKIVLIWEKDEEHTNRPKQFGETEADLEHWVVRKRLVAHDNDVQDICWSPDGSLLITVGLDRSIIIWNGTTFERVKRYDIHQSMVKGIVFDPANKFFATASDDRSVRIFRYYRKLNDVSAGNYEFQMEQIVMEPFKKSPLTSYFRRMSWSPDGQHIAVPNATNGPVTSVVIINRGNWATDVSLIGHEAPCEVCSFSPRMFRLGSKDTLTTILASGGQDRTLAIWSTALTKPLMVAEDIVGHAITDICWTPDGMSLFLSSLDGSITCVMFEKDELGEAVSAGAIASQLVRYGGDRDSAILVESTDQLALEALVPSLEPKQKGVPAAEPLTVSVAEGDTRVQSTPSPFLTPMLTTPKKAQKITQNVVITKGGRKRVAPTLLSTYSGPKKQVAPTAKVAKTFDISSKLSQTSYLLPRLGLQSYVHGLRLRSTATQQSNDSDADNDNEDMGLDESSAMHLLAQSGPSMRKKIRKYRKWLMVQKYPTPFKMVSFLPETLFCNQALMSTELTGLIKSKDVMKLSGELINTSALDGIDENLYFQVVVNTVEHMKKKGGDEQLVRSIIEVRNGPAWPEDEDTVSTDYVQRLDFQDPTQVIVTNSEDDEKKEYILYFPYRIQQVIPIIFDEELVYYVLVSSDGLIQIIRAESGTYLAPGTELGSNVVAWKQSKQYLLFLTSAGLVYCWRLPYLSKGEQRITGVVKGVSLALVLHSETNFKKSATDPKNSKSVILRSVVVDSIRAIEVDGETGVPLVVLKGSNSVYAYSTDMMAWVKSIDTWYYHSVDEADIEGLDISDVKKQVLRRSFREQATKLEQGACSRYVFNEENSELAATMKARFKELVEM